MAWICLLYTSAGCLLANLFFSPYGFLDILLGTLATFVGAIGVYALRKNKMVAFACPVISNAFLVPVVLQVAAGLPYVANLLYVAVGEGIAVYAIGLLLSSVLPLSLIHIYPAGGRPWADPPGTSSPHGANPAGRPFCR